ncbi:MAG: hypothetical protein EA360_02230 [Balneolaceae bacterium]|nr:MAG: hypothetical protein EA360_02230 [Balneolaceae bacterium]
MPRQIYHFFLHLRLHYQFFILSGGYLLGGLLADQMDTLHFWLQFLNVHLLLFGGATAYNSYWDRDEGPIGGLKNPPKMTPWMQKASLLFMFSGWFWSFLYGWIFFSVFGISLLLFWLYSTPLARWKGHPLLSLLAIAVSTGTNSVLLGFLAAGGALNWALYAGVIGAALVLLSLYPVSQIFQAAEDRKRGDQTFFIRFGKKGVQIFFSMAYLCGLLLLSYNLWQIYPIPGALLLLTGLLSYILLSVFIGKLEGVKEEYPRVMAIKFFASLSFVLFLLAANSIRYEWIGETFLRGYF